MPGRTFLSYLLGGRKVRGKLPAAVERQLSLKKRFDPRRSIMETDFVAFDTELTGLDFKQDSILSVGAIKLKGGCLLPTRTFYRLVKPQSELKEQSVVVHELTHADLKEAAEAGEVMADFLGFIADAVLVGHFVHIDVHFVNRALKQLYGISLKNPVIDTGTLHEWLCENDAHFSRHYQGITAKTDLFSLAGRYGIAAEKAHNAFYDAYVTAQLFQRFLSFLPGSGIKTVRELLAVARP